MRTVKYKLLLPPEEGSESGVLMARGNLSEMLTEMPYLLTHKVIPPLHVLNEVLRSGLIEAGANGGASWEPFEIDAEEYEALVAEMLTLEDNSLREAASPAWVKSRADWDIWLMEMIYRVPVDEHRALLEKMVELERASTAAYARGDKEAALTLQSQALKASSALSEWLTGYVDRKLSH
ncbi:MAG: hypothetical protein H7175_18700 [Burkholderiales bacterium]|nr:hypothetical protein [Anaerolineae bacterium]